MPTISCFFGIVIYLYYADNDGHHLPHIHVRHAEHRSVIAIQGGEMLAGYLPARELKLIQAWIVIHQDELIANWNLALAGKKPSKIKPLR